MKWHHEIKTLAYKVGFDDVRIEHGGKHLKVHVGKGDASRFVTVSATPSDRRTLLNVERDLRQTARSFVECPSPVPSPSIKQAIARPYDVVEIRPEIIKPEPRPARVDVCYHYTTSSHLPFILSDGCLRDADGESGGRVFATTSDRGDKCSFAFSDTVITGYEDGQILQVRVTCKREDFGPFEKTLDAMGEIVARKRLDRCARAAGISTMSWLVRSEPLSLDDVYGIEVRTYGGDWIALGATDASTASVYRDDEGVYGVFLGDDVYLSVRDDDHGVDAFLRGSKICYQSMKLDARAFLEDVQL